MTNPLDVFRDESESITTTTGDPNKSDSGSEQDEYADLSMIRTANKEPTPEKFSEDEAFQATENPT
jgi:hypothetical protein